MAAPIQQKANPEEAAAQVDRWSRGVVQPLLVTIQVTALLTALLIVLQEILNEPWPWLWPFFFLFYLETAYSTRWLRRPDQRLLGKGIFRAAELIFFAVLFRVGTWWLFGTWVEWTPELIREYLRNPLLIFDGRFWAVIVLAIVGWGIVTRIMTLFEYLGIDAAEYAYFTTTPSEREQNARPVSINRAHLFGDLFRYWATGGIFLTVFIGVNRLQLDRITVRGNLLWNQADVPLPLLVVTLIYLITGFLMLSQARLAAFSARWLMSGVEPNQIVERSWHRAGSRLLLIVIAAAALLPIGSTFPLLRGLQFIMRGLAIAAGALIAAFQFFLLFLMSLFPAAPPPPAEPLPPALPTMAPLPTPPPPPPAPPPDNSIPLLSILFWIVLIIVAVESILYFLNTRGLKVPPSLTSKIVDGLRAWWQRWKIEWAYRQSLLAELAEIETPNFPNLRPKNRWRLWGRSLRYDHLPPRERIRLFFITLSRLASGAGLARTAAESPAEYSHRLSRTLTENQEELDRLTGLFQIARYAGQDINESDARSAESAWQTLKEAVKDHGQSKTES